MTLSAPSLTGQDLLPDLTTPDPFAPPLEGLEPPPPLEPPDPYADSPWNDPKYAAEEITHGEAHAKKHQAPFKRMVEMYASKWYRDDGTAEAIPENYVFAYVDWLQPLLAYTAPAPNVEANWEKSHGEIAQWQEKAGRRWTACAGLTDTHQRWVRDGCFAGGVIQVGLESYGPDGKIRPYAEHVPFDQWGCDPRDEHLERVLFEYRRREVPIRELYKIRGADPAIIRTLKSTYDAGGVTNDAGKDQPETADRQRVTVYYVWIREEGRIGVLLASGKGIPSHQWLAKPAKWWGHPRGPFVVLGFKTVAGDPFPMSPLQAAMTKIMALNVHERAAALEADSFKTGLGVDAASPDAKEAVEKGETNGIWLIPGLARGSVQQLSLGGVHPQRLEYIDRMRDVVQRFLSLGDSQQGVPSKQTATADQNAKASNDSRVEGMRGKVHTASADLFERIMWWMFYDQNYEARITVTANAVDPMTGAPKQEEQEAYFVGGTDGGWYRGEFFPPMVDISWPEDFTVTVDPDSTSHTADQARQQDALTLLQVQSQAYQALQMMPGADVEWVVDRIGESMNIRELFGKLFTMQLVQQIQAGNPMQPVALPAGASQGMAAGTVHAQGMGRVLPPGAAGGMMAGGTRSPAAQGPGRAQSGFPGSAPPSSPPASPGRPAFA